MNITKGHLPLLLLVSALACASAPSVPKPPLLGDPVSSTGASPGAVLGRGPHGCTWVESTGVAEVSDQESPAQARALAVEQARLSAMRSVFGVNVVSHLVDYSQEGLKGRDQLVENLLLTSRQGRILQEKIVSDGYLATPSCAYCRYQAAVKDCLLPIPKAQKDFRVQVTLNRHRFVPGDQAEVSVTASKDCYLYLYDEGVDGKASLLVPNAVTGAQVRLSAGQTWTYPSASEKENGVILSASLPAGASISVEEIRAIVTTDPLPRKISDPSKGYLAVIRRLVRSHNLWNDDTSVLTIYQK